MNEQDKERLYKLMPATHRIRDAAEGEPIRALLSVIEREMKNIESDIEGLYDNWFIETCKEWVVPYIGDLLKVQGIRSLDIETLSQRAFVAHTLAYRRGKGTAAVLEQLASDLTGWRARVVEFFQLLALTPNLNHIRLRKSRAPSLCSTVNQELLGGTPDLRDTNSLELLEGPFEIAAHNADVRSVAGCGGRYNVPNIGIFMWRLQSYRVERSTARAVADIPDGRYSFDPLGRDIPLFNIPRPEPEIAHLAEEFNVPGKLRRRMLYDELEKYRPVPEKERKYIYFDRDEPVLRVFKNGEPVSLDQMLICNLGEWKRPQSLKIAVDPELGRLAFPEDEIPEKVEVSYAYGFSDDVGAGPYNRSVSVKRWVNPLDPDFRKVTWQKGVTKDREALNNDSSHLVETMEEAVTEWNHYVSNSPDPFPFGLITIMDNSTYKEELTGANRIYIIQGSKLAIIAADWALVDEPSGQKTRIVGQLTPDAYRPHVLGNISVQGGDDFSNNPGQLILDGIMIEGMLNVLVGNLGSLTIAHCTLVPDKGGLKINPSAVEERTNPRLHISIDHSICGQIIVPENVPELKIRDSIVDSVEEDYTIYAGEQSGKIMPGPSTSIERTTVFGKVLVDQMILASEVIFTGQVEVERFQKGCVRFSYVPGGSRTPRRYRCQSDRALDYLFSWDEIRDIKYERLIELLKPYFNFKWLSTGKIDSITSTMIAVSSGDSQPKDVLSLTLNTDKTRVILMLNSVRLDEFVVKIENGMMNVYTVKKAGAACGCRIGSGLKPAFTSIVYGDPGYAQLGRNCAEEIRTGAEDGSEMGVFCSLKQPQREANFRTSLDEHLGFGLEAGIFYVT
ncbi:MAG: hypothetical protein FIB08_00935 [Candidatus Methanoperedens sp.]|nr:hypothetical protein [Candidatus Methanoperedens sp.]